MSIVDNIRIIKKVHIKDIAMVQVGKFIYAYGKDAYIMSYVFGYKVRLIENNIYVCGFPRNKVKNVMATLENKKINYIILDRRNSYRVDEKSDNKNLNKYDAYLDKAMKYVKRKQKIDYIYDYLINNIEKDEIDKIIKLMKREIDERGKI